MQSNKPNTYVQNVKRVIYFIFFYINVYKYRKRIKSKSLAVYVLIDLGRRALAAKINTYRHARTHVFDDSTPTRVAVYDEYYYRL